MLRGKARDLLLVFFLLSLVSLFADVVYEGGRSVSGPLLSELSAPAAAAALIGLGEFLGFATRLLAAAIASKRPSPTTPWALTFTGYALTAISIPMIGFASDWQVVVVLYALDRIGKGVRTPGRDAILSEVSKPIGVGKGFGIHEVLDQLGAFAGPLLVSTLAATRGVKTAFITLLAPGALALTFLALAYKLSSTKTEPTSNLAPNRSSYPRSYWLYLAGVFFLALGFTHWSIASYYLATHKHLALETIGYMYALAMLVDALVALPMGALFDKYGVYVTVVAPVAAYASFLALTYAPSEQSLLVAIPWGIAASSEESILRASVSKLISSHEKKTAAYGVYGFIYGAGWGAGSLIYSTVLGNTQAMTIYATTTTVLSILFLTASETKKA